jgi:hypothetical protein
MYGESNRTEPIASTYWKQFRTFYTIPSLFEQLGGGRPRDSSTAPRDVLSLEKKASWVPTREDADPTNYMPYIQQFGDIGSTGPTPDACEMTGNWTVFLRSSPEDSIYSTLTPQDSVVWASPNLASLFEGFLENSGSLAHAISSLITILSRMAYYTQFPRF